MAGAFSIPPKHVLLERHAELQGRKTSSSNSSSGSSSVVGKAPQRQVKVSSGRPSGKRRLVFGSDDGTLLGS